MCKYGCSVIFHLAMGMVTRVGATVVLERKSEIPFSEVPVWNSTTVTTPIVMHVQMDQLRYRVPLQSSMRLMQGEQQLLLQSEGSVHMERPMGGGAYGHAAAIITIPITMPSFPGLIQSRDGGLVQLQTLRGDAGVTTMQLQLPNVGLQVTPHSSPGPARVQVEVDYSRPLLPVAALGAATAALRI